MKDPFWKRSAFWQWLYAGASLGIVWWMDGIEPTSAGVISWLGGILVVFGFQVKRPTTRASG